MTGIQAVIGAAFLGYSAYGLVTGRIYLRKQPVFRTGESGRFWTAVVGLGIIGLLSVGKFLTSL